MATFSEMMGGFGQRLQSGMNDPITQLGLQLLLASGQMPEGTRMGERLGMAGQGFMQQMGQQQERKYQEQLRQIQMGQLKKQEDQQKQEAATRQLVQQRIGTDPSILANNPLARAILESTGDVSAIKGLDEFMPKSPGAPKMPWQYQQFDPQGNATQYTYDPNSGGYQAGATYRPPQQQSVDVRQQAQQLGQQQWETEQQFKERQQADLQGYRGAQVEQGGRRVGIAELQAQAAAKRAGTAEQQAATAASRAEVAAAQEARRAEEAVRTRKIDRANLQAGYRGAKQQISDSLSLLDQIVNHKGFGSTFGAESLAPTMPGSDSANLQALIKKFQSGAGLSELVRLGKAGVTLTPVSNVDIEMLKNQAAAIDFSQGDDAARQQFQTYIDVLKRAAAEADTSFGQLDSLYNSPSSGSSPGAPAVGTVEDGYEFMGGDPADPNSWRKR